MITNLFFFVMIAFQTDQFLNLFHLAAVQAPALAQEMAQSKGKALGWPLNGSPRWKPVW